MSRFQRVKNNVIEYKQYSKELLQRELDLIDKFGIKRNCPLCNDKDGETVMKTNVTEFVECKSCKLTYAKKILDNKSNVDFYKTSEIYKEEQIKQYNHLRENGIITNETSEEIKKLNINKDKLMDFGCGLGETLYLLKNEFKEVIGVEISEYAKEKSKELFEINIVEEIDNRKYDCIILDQVIEHLDDLEIMQVISERLEERGVLYLSCPNVDSISMKILGKDHIHLQSLVHINMFGFWSMERLAQKLGLKVEYIKSDNNLDLDIMDLIKTRSRSYLHRYNMNNYFSILLNGVFKVIRKLIERSNILEKTGKGSYLKVALRK